MILDELIFDRTIADINRVNYLHKKVSLKTATVAEFEEWQKPLKGSSNYQDLNRVSNALEYLVPVLRDNGYYPTFKKVLEMNVSLKNQFSNSNFSKGIENWTNHLGANITINNGVCTADGTGKGAIYLTQNFSQTIKNHKVYASVKILKCRGQQTLYYELPYSFFDVVYDIAEPTKMSGILTISNEMEYGGILNQTGNSMVIFTEPLMIDLTESFGLGNEPTKEWCDKNLSYFDGIKNATLPRYFNNKDIRYVDIMDRLMYNIKQVASGKYLGIPLSFDGFTYVHENNVEKALFYTPKYMGNKNTIRMHVGTFYSGGTGGLRR